MSAKTVIACGNVVFNAKIRVDEKFYEKLYNNKYRIGITFYNENPFCTPHTTDLKFFSFLSSFKRIYARNAAMAQSKSEL